MLEIQSLGDSRVQQQSADPIPETSACLTNCEKTAEFEDIFIKASQRAHTPRCRWQRWLKRPCEVGVFARGRNLAGRPAALLRAFLLEATARQVWIACGSSLATEPLGQMAFISLFYEGEGGGGAHDAHWKVHF